MLKDSKFSSHLLHLSQLQTVNHKTLDEYRERLTTFEDSLWFGKPDPISAIECARRGWKCRGNDTIECVNCHAELTAILPSILKIDEYRNVVENTARALVESHRQYCVWKFMIIPESTVQLNEIYSNETINRFLNEAEEFLTRIQSIEIVGQMNSFEIHPTDFDLLASSHLNDPRLLSAFKIVIFCWKFKDSTLTCEKCCRVVPISFVHLKFDPITSHRSWCPILKTNQWKHRLEQIESILHRKSRQKLNEFSSSTKSEQTDDILKEIVSTQELFHELISSKEYYRSCVQNNFNDDTSATDIEQLKTKSIST